MLGVPAQLRFIFASKDNNCLELDRRNNDPVANTDERLIMFFGDLPNWYEGVCFCAEAYYAVTPHEKEPTDKSMLISLIDHSQIPDVLTQRWCTLRLEIKVGDEFPPDMVVGQFQPKP